MSCADDIPAILDVVGSKSTTSKREATVMLASVHADAELSRSVASGRHLLPMHLRSMQNVCMLDSAIVE